MIELREKGFGIKTNKKFMSIQLGDMCATAADTMKARGDLGYDSKIIIEEGIEYFVKWYLDQRKDRLNTI